MCTSTWTSRSCPRGGISVTEVRGTRPASENCSRTYVTGSMQVDIPVIVQRSVASSRCSTFVLDSRLFYDDAGRCTKGSIYIRGFHFLFRKEKERERAGRNRFRGGRPGRAPRRGRDRKRTSAGMSCPRATPHGKSAPPGTNSRELVDSYLVASISSSELHRKQKRNANHSCAVELRYYPRATGMVTKLIKKVSRDLL